MKLCMSGRAGGGGGGGERRKENDFYKSPLTQLRSRTLPQTKRGHGKT